MTQETKCWSCNKVLIDREGKRLHGAVFDSSIKERPKKKPVIDDGDTDCAVIWALCEDCWPKYKTTQKTEPDIVSRRKIQ